MVYVHIAAITVIFIAAMTVIWFVSRWGIEAYGPVFGFAGAAIFIGLGYFMDWIGWPKRRASGRGSNR